MPIAVSFSGTVELYFSSLGWKVPFLSFVQSDFFSWQKSGVDVDFGFHRTYRAFGHVV